MEDTDGARRGAELTAAQAALAAEHAAVYGYGVIGARVGDDRRQAARDAYAAHRARREVLARRVRDLGATPRAARAGYALPYPVPDAVAAARFAAELEDRVAGVYADLVRAATGAVRQEAAGALREAALRSARWRGGGVAFPGLAEHPDAPAPVADAQDAEAADGSDTTGAAGDH
ncbi:ferritin-like domain-containing protein [Streptomyces sp. JJ66]|uniref:ferritin-like domain-containing protein n=1 Tax=Streptomyces sp. JJ66 TaxID=2803843 RepID=UPI001C5849F2|nr:ferritin-like domain-containing protein [Streptomyces sp. JJ66]MBW1601225.1 ferritin-like domain-containing protein [Streptomyces sp. JJ66]